MAMKYDTLTCTALIENLDPVIEFVEDCADRLTLETQKKFGLLIAAEEAFVNVCHYAYKDGDGEASIACGADAENLVLEISDGGAPFDVLSLPDPDTTSDIMDRQIGGLGVHFIRKLSDDVSYRRENGLNILRLVFHRTRDTP